MATPHLKIPFQVGTDHAVMTVEQDTIDEIAQCVSVLLLTTVGERLEVPDYGIPDITFNTTLPLATIRTAIERWEPRATAMVTDEVDSLDELLRHIGVTLSVGS